MSKLSKDLSSGTLHPREALFGTAVLSTIGAELVVPADGSQSVSLDVRGTPGTTLVEYSVDGVNYTFLPVRSAVGGAYTAAVTAAGVYHAALPPCRLVRVRMTVASAGATVVLLASASPLDQSLTGAVTTSVGTAVGASGAAVTLTLPSPGAGLRHYLTYLSVVRYAAAILVGSATPVTVTTTNLPGPLAITLPADAGLLGTSFPWREDFAYPIAANAQATNTTIVCPATVGVIWRVTCGYYVAP